MIILFFIYLLYYVILFLKICQATENHDLDSLKWWRKQTFCNEL